MFWIRGHAPTLTALECVQVKARELRAQSDFKPDALETPDSDGLAEAVLEVIQECLAPIKNTPDGRLLRIVMDLDRKRIEQSARDRRTAAGREFRGRDAKGVGESAVRQIHEPLALNRLTDLVLEREESLVGGRE